VTEYQISEVARRSGFSTSTLRFYETVGLLARPARSQGGYRVYDEQVLDRLRFIGRAKQLGLPLEEIRELVIVWDGGACASVQVRLRQLLADKIDEVQDRVAEFSVLSDELADARSALGQSSPDGPCGPDCGCVPRSTDSTPSPVAAPPVPARPPDASSAPVMCTLTGTDQPARFREWREVIAGSVRTPSADGMSLAFAPDPQLAGRLAELAAREQQCCSFLGFRLALTADALILEVRAAPDAQDVVRSLFGEAA
jgi:DNA-binding transcriptional MerR regulator